MDADILGLTARLGELVGKPHEPTLREIADIEREPVYVAPPTDPLADLRANVVKHMPEVYQRVAIAWIELAFVKGGTDALQKQLARMDAR